MPKSKGRRGTKQFLLNLGLKAWPIPRLERRRRRKIRIRYIDNNHQYIIFKKRFAELYADYPPQQARAKKCREAAIRACDTPCSCSCPACGNPRRKGWDKPKTRAEYRHELVFREQLADYKIKDLVCEDCWMRSWGLMDQWRGADPDWYEEAG